MGENLAKEVMEQYKTKSHFQKIQKISFIGHSLGGLVIRAALTHLQQLKNKLHTFMSLSSPHLGCEINESFFVSLGMKLMKNLKNSSVLRELDLSDKLSFQNCVLYKLSLMKEFAWFKNYIFVSSRQDSFVNFESARIQITPHLMKLGKEGKRCQILAENIFCNFKSDKIIRISIDMQTREKSLSWIMGQAQHLQLLESHNIQKRFKICQFCDRKFQHRSSLSRHKKKHIFDNQFIGKPFDCQKCNKYFTQKHNLKRHHKICKKQKQQSSSKSFPKNYEIVSQIKPCIQKEDDIHQLGLCQNEQHQFLFDHNNQIVILCETKVYDINNNSIKPPIYEERQSYDYPINELSHYEKEQDLNNIISDKIIHLKNKILYDRKFCSIMRGECKQIIQKSIKNEKCVDCCSDCSNCKCYCDENLIKKHNHQNCNHFPIQHNNHIDYIVNGVLHHKTRYLCFNHGYVKLSNFIF